jgi:aerobic carbon-monoxide dehydrogenase medium subunit
VHVKPVPFTYLRARSLDEALAGLDAEGEAKILAGGQSLVPLLNMRLVRPTALVDINGVPGLEEIRAAPHGGLVIGALVRHTDLLASPLVRARAPLLATATAHIGHRAIRNRGTLGGSLAHADPAAELPAAIVALDATLTLVGPGARRRVAGREFFRGPLTTALGPREILTEIEIPGPAAPAWGFAELARRPGDFALAGVAAVLEPAPDDRPGCASARLVAFGVADTPLRLSTAEAHLAGARLDAGLARAAGERAAAGCAPPDDVHASGAYRRHLVAVLTEQTILEAAARLPS